MLEGKVYEDILSRNIDCVKNKTFLIDSLAKKEKNDSKIREIQRKKKELIGNE